MYAKQHYPKPRFSEEAVMMLNQYYVGVRKRFGSPRIRETIFRIAQNLAKLKLKDVVDAADAKETMQYYNFVLLEMEMVVVAVSHNPREEAFEECVTILSESIFPIAFEELLKRACERNQQVDKYIGRIFKLEYNKRLRPILDMLRNHSRIKGVRMNPIVLQYIQDVQDQSDPSDPSDLDLDTPAKKSGETVEKDRAEIFVQGSRTRSDRSDRSDSIYEHLIERKHLPNLNRTAFHCKECPDAPVRSSREENQARNEAENREDISGPEDTYPRDDTIPSREMGENRAQIGIREGIEGSEDIYRISLEHDASTTIYRLGQSDTFACQNCKMRGDKWFMGQHECNGKKKS
jgi:hypothetical protein